MEGKHWDFLHFKNKTKLPNKLTEVVTESGLESKSMFGLWLDLQDS